MSSGTLGNMIARPAAQGRMPKFASMAAAVGVEVPKAVSNYDVCIDRQMVAMRSMTTTTSKFALELPAGAGGGGGSEFSGTGTDSTMLPVAFCIEAEQAWHHGTRAGPASGRTAPCVPRWK